jgi:hypothetical protein
MIIVTGAPRTGTSLMMQTLQILGVPITGEAFSNINPFIGNIKGYWELPEEEISAGITNTRYEGKAVKLFAAGLYNTKEVLINKIIYCHRDEQETVASFLKLIKKVPIRMEPTIETAEKVVKANKELIESYLDVCNKPVFRVYFKEMLAEPERVISGLCAFLKIQPGTGKIQEAIDNIMRGE